MALTVAGPVSRPARRLRVRSAREVINLLTSGYSQLDHDVTSYKREESPLARYQKLTGRQGAELSATFRRFSGARRIRAVADRVRGAPPAARPGAHPCHRPSG